MTRRPVAALVASLVLVLGTAGLAAGAPSPTSFSKISAYDLQQLGFEFAPIALGAAPDRLTAADAAAIAASELAVQGQPEVKQLEARILPDQPKQPVWVVVYDGGDPIDVPWGPFSDDLRPLKAPTYSGVLIDDATGQVLVTFRGGSQ
jgi:hypothetical protein